jgi:Protein of unknown function (DUF2442)
MKAQKSSPLSKQKVLPRLKAVDVVLHGVLKLCWDDGMEGLVDLRPIIARGNVFVWLEEPTHFQTVCLSEYGHSIGWVDDAGRHIEFGADMLHALCIKQRELLRLAS